jgi:oxysterol-binding protein-related protein 1/2
MAKKSILKTDIEVKNKRSVKEISKAYCFQLKNSIFFHRWFNPEVNPFTKQDDWMFKGGYWDRNYEEFQDIEIF